MYQQHLTKDDLRMWFLLLVGIVWLIWEFSKEKNTVNSAIDREQLVQQFVDKYCDKDLEESLRKYVDKYYLEKDVLDNVNNQLKQYIESNGPLYIFEKERVPPEIGWWRFAEEGFPSQHMSIILNKDIMARLLLETHGKITEQYARGLTNYDARNSDGVTNEKIRQWIITPPWISGNYVKWSDKNYPPIRR